MDKFEKARQNINEIDLEMAKLFEKRMEAVMDVAEYKKEKGLPIFDADREKLVINRNSAYIKDETIKEYYINFITETMEISKRYQHRMISGMKVAYSGTEGAFACIAAGKIFPTAVRISYPNFTEAYQAVVNGFCDCAVLPLENSYGGEVTQVYDMTFEGNLFINGIYDLPVTHELVALPEANISDIKTVISHSQALSQCADYIKEHGFSQIQYENTALAAKYVAEKGDKSIAAIASKESAAVYGLTVIDKNINDSKQNTTRFGVFSRAQNERIGYDPDDRFILMFTVRNEAGALAEAMNIIGRRGFNMRSIKSRPMHRLLWEYYFYVECEGAVHSENGKRMLEQLSMFCDKLKIAAVYSGKNCLLS